jgi:hypothetical protein
MASYFDKGDYQKFLESGKINELIEVMTFSHIGHPLFGSIVWHLEWIIMGEILRGKSNQKELAKACLNKMACPPIIGPHVKLDF